MREVADRERIEAFLNAMAREADADTSIRKQFALMEANLYRFPAIDPASFRGAVDAVFPP